LKTPQLKEPNFFLKRLKSSMQGRIKLSLRRNNTFLPLKIALIKSGERWEKKDWKY